MVTLFQINIIHSIHHTYMLPSYVFGGVMQYLFYPLSCHIFLSIDVIKKPGAFFHEDPKDL